MKKHINILPVFKILLLACLLASTNGICQNTIGLTLQSDASTPGYTLFAPFQSTETYLIDNCGYKIMEWTSEATAGSAAYLMPDGNLVRAGSLPNDIIFVSGRGGLIEIKDWNDEVIWSYTLSDSLHALHHDLEIMPNGNILAIASEYMSEDEARQAGRPAAEGEVYNEKIIEIQPNYTTGEANIVWQWSAWDHLVQDADSTLGNYGDVANSPGRLDINNYNTAQLQRDWLHVNSIDYNEALDQILLTSRNFEELWIIDHSTTTTEAATSQGGINNSGGDLLYRWGNPQSYKQGDAAEKKLGRPHDAQWVSSTEQEGDRIMIFNNNFVNGNASAVHLIDVPINGDGGYMITDSVYGPTDYAYTYKEDGFYSSFASGAEMLESGHLLICDADSGRFFEVDDNDQVIWEYINPVTLNGIVDQGTDADNVSNNAVFKVEKYALDYEGLLDKDLTPKGPIELMSDYDCTLMTSTHNLASIENEVILFPNPVTDRLIISSAVEIENYAIFSMQGQCVIRSAVARSSKMEADVSQLQKGSYMLQTTLSSGQITTQKIIIQ